MFQASLRDAWGEPLEEIVETPPCQYENGIFQAGHTAILSNPVSKMPEGLYSHTQNSLGSPARSRGLLSIILGTGLLFLEFRAHCCLLDTGPEPNLLRHCSQVVRLDLQVQ